MKAINIEANTCLLMARTMILPAALRYQREIGESIAAAKAAGASSPAGLEAFGSLVSGINELTKSIKDLEAANSHHGDGDPYSHAKSMKEKVLPAMLAVRKAADSLEGMVADDLWPLPTYREMLFIR